MLTTTPYAHKCNTHQTDYLPNTLESTIVIHECDQIEIEDIISSLNPRKATGPNSIPSDILNILKKDISHPLSIIFNIYIFFNRNLPRSSENSKNYSNL